MQTKTLRVCVSINETFVNFCTVTLNFSEDCSIHPLPKSKRVWEAMSTQNAELFEFLTTHFKAVAFDNV